MPFEKFTAFLKANGFNAALSAGAFTEGKLRGFILNGIREYRGMLTAYDGGTGVTPEYRKRGFVKGAFAFCLPLLKTAGVKAYVLEVIESNEPALRLYKSFGFTALRELVCYRIKRDKLKAADAGVRITDAAAVGSDAVAFWDYSPTWQNTFDSVNAVSGQCAAAVMEQNGETAGYGIINTKSGNVYQLAVESGSRGTGMGSRLLRTLAHQTEAEYISLLNVDLSCGSMLGFLEKLGFEEYVRQYEMELCI
jgi:ribosomal protein S18 acetylase RimI-like enzyme